MSMITSLVRQHPRLALALGLIALIVVGGLVLAIFLASRSFAAPLQPLVFQHRKHVEAGVNCLFCHPGAQTGAVAGLPSIARCMGCHVAVVPKDPKDQPDIDRLVKQWESRKPIQWVRVFEQPDFVHFNHRPHIASGVACETCHGDVSQMGYARPYNLNMGFCLNCHRQQAPEKVARLIDCATCHY
jgi:hypothetical protein